MEQIFRLRILNARKDYCNNLFDLKYLSPYTFTAFSYVIAEESLFSNHV